MGKGINIFKYKEEGYMHYYEVSTNSNNTDFYIKIDAKNKLVFFYKNSDCSDYLGIIDFTRENPLSNPIQGLDKASFFSAGMRAGLALEKNNFPNSIGFSS